MSSFTIIDHLTGKIVSRFTCPDFADEHQAAPPGCELIRGSLPGTHVINGEFVTIGPTLDESKARAKAAINNDTSDKILARLPDWKQRNLTARAVDLMQQGISSSPELDEIRAQWQWVESVRAASNVATAAVDAASDQAGIDLAIIDFKLQLEAL